MDFLTRKHDFSLAVRKGPASPGIRIGHGEILVRLVKFGLTANNISYAGAGDRLGYWEFFPVDTNNVGDKKSFPSDVYGRVPVWGIGVVIASRCDKVGQDERIYGYFPMSQFEVLAPVDITRRAFVDGREHRRELPLVYNQYLFCKEDPYHTPRTEDAMIVLRPLFVTSWLLLDFFLAMSPVMCGATSVIISSASSKTSIGLAYMICQHKTSFGLDWRIVGLTSVRNADFVRELGMYDQIVTYDKIETEIDKLQPSCYVDMAGNTQVTTQLHDHLQQNMKYSCLVGTAHIRDGGRPKKKLPGARPIFFFAPSWIAQRIHELGNGDMGKGTKILQNKIMIDYASFVDQSIGDKTKNKQGWLKFDYRLGEGDATEGYNLCVQGKVKPNTAMILSLWYVNLHRL